MVLKTSTMYNYDTFKWLSELVVRGYVFHPNIIHKNRTTHSSSFATG